MKTDFRELMQKGDGSYTDLKKKKKESLLFSFWKGNRHFLIQNVSVTDH